MELRFTKEQEQVISLRDRNILVSAAAGSGKTAVLVQRIITRLIEDVPPIDIDKMLIVTYTEAAAAEMKERIRMAIEQKLEILPDNVHLQRQATLIHSAQITTIHSFCLSVIREHFHKIDLDPGFRIGEEGEWKLLKNDVLREVLEQRYEEGSPAFLEFVECFATGKDDKRMEELILQLFEFSRSYPDPSDWLTNCAKAYEVEGLSGLEELEAMRLAKQRVKQYAEDAKGLLREGILVCESQEGPYMYGETLHGDLASVEALCKAKTFDELYEVITRIKWGRLAPNRDKEVLEAKTEFVKQVRGDVKKVIADLCDQYFFQTPQELFHDMEHCRSVVTVLTGLVQEFADAFDRKKREKNLIDFGDMEQFALQILTEKVEGERIPTSVAKEYQSLFAEVMIDEYQDSNYIQEAILTSVSTVWSGKNNIFMVGDVKQSIYRFRLSRPELFMEKFQTYSQEDSATQRIDLHKNFRSRREVLEGANFLFRQMMTKPLGGITYDDRAALYVGASYEEQPGNETEVLFVNTETAADAECSAEETDRELEARAVAGRIKELVGSHPVLDKHTGGYRPARYQDMVILTRSLQGWSDVFAQILTREGIPSYTGTREGYFKTQEIGTVLDYLRILNNPRQDIPLASVMTSPIGGFTGEELARVKMSARDVPFHAAVLSLSTEDVLSGKVHKFLEQMEYFRKMVPYMAIHELLYRILAETGYGDYARTMPGGEQRNANLDMLIEKAKAFGTTSYKGLFNFVRYMEQLQKYDVDFGEANIADEQADTVRIMSIHKSKGLEFPIVFVVGMSKRFNTQDGKGSIIVHPDLGIGIDAIDLERRTKAATFLKKVIRQEVLNENLGEELRVLYVAMTRAKEKLILTGTVKNLQKKLQGYENVRLQQDEKLSFYQLTKAGTYFDWVIPALIRNGAFAGILESYGIPAPFTNPLYMEAVPILCREIRPEETVAAEMREEAGNFFTRQQLEEWDTAKTYDAAMKKQIEEQFSFQYPYQAEQQLKLKFTVSELKKREYTVEEAGEVLYEEPDVVPLLPKFLQKEEKLKGAGRGTAYHKFLELHDFHHSYDKEGLQAEIEIFRVAGKLSDEMAACILPEDILTFLNTDLGKRMQKAACAGLLHKEQPFVLGVPATELYPEEKGGETILIQGIIDVYFEENGQLIVADYKTDHIKTKTELAQKYQKQLEYYAQALEQLTGKKVKEKIIHAFAIGDIVNLN